jgi:hypothetical protein
VDHRTATRLTVERIGQQARLMVAVMERTGVDFSLTAREDGFAAASRRCLVCMSSEPCRRWLEQGGGDVVPPFCPNAPFFDRMRSRCRGR